MRFLKKHLQGFALIATITLMVLLALLSVGLLTMSASQTRISQKGLYAAEARAQARLALEVAIGKLQCELGPDQRVSANSGILDTSVNSESIDGVASPHILGVWNSWDTWMNRKSPTHNYSLTDTYTKGRQNMFRSWLISDSRMEFLTRLNSVSQDLGQDRADRGRKILLLGEGTLGLRADRKDEIYAGLVQVDDSTNVMLDTVSKKNSRTVKNIAWWVSAENQKARINLPAYKDRLRQDVDKLRATWNTPPPDNSSIRELASLNSTLSTDGGNAYDEQVSRLITRGTVLLQARNSRDIPSLFHDVSLYASGLQTDSKFGGLKKDMNIMMSQKEVPDEFRTASHDVGLRPYNNEDGNAAVTVRPIASWPQFYYWSNIWDGATVRNGQDASATLKWDGKRPYTLVAADAEAVSTMMNNRYTYMRNPIMLRQYNFIGYTYTCWGNSYGGIGAKDGGMVIPCTFITPVSVWWNPYNVSMKFEGANGEPFGTYVNAEHFLPLKSAYNFYTDYTHCYSNGQSSYVDDSLLSNYSDKSYTSYTVGDGGFGYQASVQRPLADYGSSLRDKVEMSTDGSPDKGDVSFLSPGEIVMYSQPNSDRPIWPPTYEGGSKFDAQAPHPAQAKNKNNDIRVDNYPLKEGWSEELYQVTAYGWSFVWVGVRFDSFYGSSSFPTFPQPNSPQTHTYRKAKVDFIPKASELSAEPRNAVLSQVYTDEGKESGELSSYVSIGGLMDPDLIGKSYPLKEESGSSSSSIPDSFAKKSPAFYNLNWGVWEDPLIQEIRFPHELYRDRDNPESPYDNKDPGTIQANGYGYKKLHGAGGIGAEKYDFVAYYGLSVKWSQTPLVGTYPEDKDYRTKIWQHSSPLFWGNQMVAASDLSRTYSPYQFEVKHHNDPEGFAPITIANVLNNDGTRLTTFGGPGAEQINKISATEIPIHPPYSIAGFAGARLTPGWYTQGNDSPATIAKRFAYQSGVPGIGIGNSFADPMIPGDRVFIHSEISGDKELGDFWDHALMANDGVWDSWFASSISNRPTQIGGNGGREEFTEVLKDILSDKKDSTANVNSMEVLPNSRFSLNPGADKVENVINELSDSDGYKKVAKYVNVEGAFNVNSTSMKAWKSVIKGLKDRQLLFNSSTNGVTPMNQDKNTAYFSRFGVASSDQSHVDDYGSVGITNGLTDGVAQVWSDLRKIDENTLDRFTENLVAEVKKRGPFLNMAEFVNRRLASGDLGLKGAIQAAIDNTGINSVFDQVQSSVLNPSAPYPNPEAARGNVFTGAPGYLIQSDILAVLGNILTTRDDTFTIRAYGELTTKSGKNILSRAWCEAVVKRGVDYVDPTDAPETPAYQPNTSTGSLDKTQLSNINRAFGRKFDVISFRWLSPEEV
ncbi:hypothetical protein QET93_003260 [Akkermansia sp. N21116]|uniref:hypothetical protein n=1 Tax=Akkermansia sp. N21116 TaxID=3040764 RepID=UPI002AC92C96|nr:hypothetical protein [Akkermansia sp. N21116]WPX41121.1 hypothetical protein QET93_003260 [Akkermansia sp. N21116]